MPASQDIIHYLLKKLAKLSYSILVMVTILLMSLLQPAVAQQADAPLNSSSPEGLDRKVYLPLVSGNRLTIVQQIADNLPSGCHNCLSQEAFLALSPEELGEIEVSERKMEEFGRQIEEQSAYIRSLIQAGKIDTSAWPTDVQIEKMSAEELQQVNNQQNETLQEAISGEVIQAANISTLLQTADYVTIPIFRVPENEDLINACGPNAIKISLGVHIPQNQVPWLDPIGDAVDDGDWHNGLEGEDISRMRNYLQNTLLNHNPNLRMRYTVGSSGWAGDAQNRAAAEFRNKVISSVGMGFTMIFGVQSQGMPDWHVRSLHIVTAYGYTWNSTYTTSWIRWADGNNRISGHYRDANGNGFLDNSDTDGNYFNYISTTSLWLSARENDFQIYHLANG